MLVGICTLIIIVWCVELVGYICLTPNPAQAPKHERSLYKHCGTLLYGIAYIFSLLRMPLGLLPYLLKIWIQLGLKFRYEAHRITYERELLNMVSEFANLAGTWALVQLFVGSPRLQWWVVLCYLPIWAECLRLLTEYIPILFSTAWQLTPHRQFACFLQQRLREKHLWKAIERYCYYYSLNDIDRAAFLLETLKRWSVADVEMSRRLRYLRAFRVVPLRHGLRSGVVRDVARGEIFSTFQNDQCLFWLEQQLRRGAGLKEPRPLYCDEEVIAEQAPKIAKGQVPTAQEIAEQYVYPLAYVEEVLLPQLMQMGSIAH